MEILLHHEIGLQASIMKLKGDIFIVNLKTPRVDFFRRRRRDHDAVWAEPWVQRNEPVDASFCSESVSWPDLSVSTKFRIRIGNCVLVTRKASLSSRAPYYAMILAGEGAVVGHNIALIR